MTTTLRTYFAAGTVTSSGLAPAVAPVWDYFSGQRADLLVAPPATSPSAGTIPATSANRIGCSRQFVGAPADLAALVGRTISGTFRGVITMRRATGIPSAYGRVVVRVVSGDGLTVRGTLVDTLSTAALSTSNTGIRFTAALSHVTIQSGDRLLLEVGAEVAGGSSSVAITYAGGPADMDWTTPVVNDRPWFELLVTDAPNPPTGLIQTGATSATVDVAWTAPAAGAAPTGYDVRVDAGPPSAVGLVTATTIGALAAATPYTVEVRTTAPSGVSAWVSVVATTAAAPPPPDGPQPGDYSTHLRVGDHVWDVEPGDATYGPLAGLRFEWTARPDDGWPTQHDPTVLVFGIIVAAGTDFDDVDQGTVVHFTFTPTGAADPLVSFGGTVRDLIGRPHPRGMVYEVTAVDHLQKLREDYHTATFIPASSPASDVWALAVQDAATHGSLGTSPTLPDPLAGDTPVGTPGGFTADDVTLDAPTWDVLTGIAAAMVVKPGSPATYERVVLGYQLDAAGDLDAAHPFEGTWMAPADAAAPLDLPGALLLTGGTEWSRPRLEPNVVHVDPDGFAATYVRPHTGVDVVRVMTTEPAYLADYTDPTWVTAGLEGTDQWTSLLTLLAYLDPELVAGWFELPTAMATYVQCHDIDSRHTPNGSGEVSGMLAGAALVIPPGGAWFVTFTLRRTLPAPIV